MDRTHSTQTLDNHLTEQVARTVRATLREELRTELRAASANQRRRATFYAASGAAALHCGAALALAIGLVLVLGLPAWGAALVTAVLLAAAALFLRGAARPRADATLPPSQGG
ncbi:phage holin family protein [Streptomyces sp. NPDC056910]|uniref:phage holin family protein n=1 Tax=Streptomyces sp. NPDC056910 TaxID=3345964 RepID=UPI0036776F66